MSTETVLQESAALAARLVNHTNKNIFLTGKAGTGKTTFLKYIVKHTHKKNVIAAPTGIAALNAGGVTLHSLFQLPFGGFIPVNSHDKSASENIKLNDPGSLLKGLHMYDAKRNLLRSLELLVIDEVSMLRADLLDAIDLVLRTIRRKPQPFGGVQVLFIGDLLQLPPVVKEDEWSVLRKHYQSLWFFDALVLQREKPVYIELDKIYRQSDQAFITLLNHLRNNEVEEEDINLLNQYYKPDFVSSVAPHPITLTTHNYKAAQINQQLLGELKSPSFFYEAVIEGEFSEYAFPVEKKIELKRGAQVMFVKNDPTGAQRFFNGKIGIVSDLDHEEISVQFENEPYSLTVEKYLWKNVRYTHSATTGEIEEEETGSFTQFPLRLAWAITVHKSQGLTFDKAIVDIGAAFAPGQVYVALSRLRSLDGLILRSPINYRSIGNDQKVEEFAHTKSRQEDPELTAERETLLFLRSYLLGAFDPGPFHYHLQQHAESYSMEENRSAKQKHRKWANELVGKHEELKKHASAFRQQIARIMDEGEANMHGHLLKRVNDAVTYFSPLLGKMKENINVHIQKVSSGKKMKTYLKELSDLELRCFEQKKNLLKALALTRSVTENNVYEQAEVNGLIKDEEQQRNLKEHVKKEQKHRPEKKESRVSAPLNVRVKKKEDRGPKTDTRTESFMLFKQGKSVAEIAEIRGFSVTTIEGHLSTFVAKGELEATLFVSTEKIERVIAISKKLNTFVLTPIKQELGDSHSYGEIRMALAAMLASLK